MRRFFFSLIGAAVNRVIVAGIGQAILGGRLHVGQISVGRRESVPLKRTNEITGCARSTGESGQLIAQIDAGVGHIPVACRASCRTGGNTPENRLSDVKCLTGSEDKVTGVIADDQAVSGKSLLYLDGAAADSIIGVRIVY